MADVRRLLILEGTVLLGIPTTFLRILYFVQNWFATKEAGHSAVFRMHKSERINLKCLVFGCTRLVIHSEGWSHQKILGVS